MRAIDLNGERWLHAGDLEAALRGAITALQVREVLGEVEVVEVKPEAVPDVTPEAPAVVAPPEPPPVEPSPPEPLPTPAAKKRR